MDDGTEKRQLQKIAKPKDVEDKQEERKKEYKIARKQKQFANESGNKVGDKSEIILPPTLKPRRSKREVVSHTKAFLESVAQKKNEETN